MSAAGRLARAGLETFAAAYDAWLELKLARASAAAARAAEQARLEGEATYLVGAVEKARALRSPAAAAPGTSEALARPADPLGAFAAEARARLDAAREALAARAADEEAGFAAREAELRGAIVSLADRAAAFAIPLELDVARLGGGAKVVVHLRQPSDDDAVRLLRLLHGTLPTRHGFLRDDAADEVGRPPPRFYPDEGLTGAELAPGDDGEDALCERFETFLPVRGILPVRLPAAAPLRFRLAHRGPVLELEGRRPGEPWTHLLAHEDAELFTGHLLLLKLEGRVALDLRFA